MDERRARIHDDLRGLIGGDLAAGVVAVGQGDQDPLGGVGAAEEGDGQADRVAQGGLGAGHADPGLGQQFAASVQVLGERHLDERGAAEDDQADNLRKLQDLADTMASLGFGFDSTPYDLVLMALVTIFTLLSVSFYLVEWARHMSTIEAN